MRVIVLYLTHAKYNARRGFCSGCSFVCLVWSFIFPIFCLWRISVMNINFDSVVCFQSLPFTCWGIKSVLLYRIQPTRVALANMNQTVLTFGKRKQFQLYKFLNILIKVKLSAFHWWFAYAKMHCMKANFRRWWWWWPWVKCKKIKVLSCKAWRQLC